MLRWLPEDVATPYGVQLSVLSWSVDTEGVEEDHPLPDLDDAQDQLGAVLWNSNDIVSHYLHTNVFEGSHPKNVGIIELGAGVGALGITLAAGGAQVMLTDLKELVPLMQRNIRRNMKLMQGRCEAVAWKWGENMPQSVVDYFRDSNRRMVVLLCDALYGNPKDWPALIKTLNDIVGAFGAVEVYNFCEQRVEVVEDAFLQLICGDGSWNSITSDLQGASALGMKVRVTKLGTAQRPKRRREDDTDSTKEEVDNGEFKKRAERKTRAKQKMSGHNGKDD